MTTRRRKPKRSAPEEAPPSDAAAGTTDADPTAAPSPSVDEVAWTWTPRGLSGRIDDLTIDAEDALKERGMMKATVTLWRSDELLYRDRVTLDSERGRAR